MSGGRILVALLILFGLLGSLVTGAAIYSRLLYLGLLLVTAAGLWSWLTSRSLSVSRRSRLQRAGVGDIFEEHFEVINGGRLTALWVEVSNDTTLPFASGSRLLTLIPGRQKRSYLARTWLTRRGRFPLGPTTLTAGDPFGLFRIQMRSPAEKSLTVLPMVFEIGSFLSPPGLLPGGQVIRRKTVDVTLHAAGVREYVPGDPMKRIHWLTTARRGQLMVKEFEQDPQAEVWLFLDAQEKVHFEKPHEVSEAPVEAMLFGRRPKFSLPPSTLEYAISITASLAHYFIQQRRAVGLVTAGRVYTVIPAERSHRQESKILETLSFVEARGELSLAALVAAYARQLPQGSSAILVTPTVWPELLLAVDDLLRRRLRPVVVLLVSDTFGGPRGSEALTRSLMERNVPVCSVHLGADLAQALSGFTANTISQDGITWQRPPLSHLT